MKGTCRRVGARMGWIGAGAAALMVLFGLAATPALFAQQAPLTLTFGPGRDATQPGTVTLTAQGNQTVVTVNVTPGTAGVAQPGHIHEGSCPGVGAVKYPLTNIENGKSTTTVNAPLASFTTGGYSINLHRGPGADANIYTACVNITAVSASGTGAAASGTTGAAAPQMPRTGSGGLLGRSSTGMPILATIVGSAALLTLLSGLGWVARRTRA